MHFKTPSASRFGWSPWDREGVETIGFCGCHRRGRQPAAGTSGVSSGISWLEGSQSSSPAGTGPGVGSLLLQPGCSGGRFWACWLPLQRGQQPAEAASPGLPHFHPPVCWGVLPLPWTMPGGPGLGGSPCSWSPTGLGGPLPLDLAGEVLFPCHSVPSQKEGGREVS